MKSSPIYTDANIGRIKAMQIDGASHKEIAAAIGSTERSVSARISQLGLAHPDVKRRNVAIAEIALAACAPHAARRDLSTADLIRVLVDRIVRDDLFEAILDDGA